MSDIKVGDKVRLTGKFLRNTGQAKGEESRKRWTVSAIVHNGEWAVVDEKTFFFVPEDLIKDPSLAYRRIALANLERCK